MRSYGNNATDVSGPAKGDSEHKIDVKFIVVLIALVIAIGVIIFFVLRNNAKAETAGNVMVGGNDLVLDASAISDTTDATGQVEDDTTDENVAFQGYEDMVLSQDQGVRLANDPSNVDLYMKYVIIDSDGNVVYETDLIPPGDYVRVVLSDYMEYGTYDMRFVQKAYSSDENGGFKFVTEASNAVNVTIEG